MRDLIPFLMSHSSLGAEGWQILILYLRIMDPSVSKLQTLARIFLHNRKYRSYKSYRCSCRSEAIVDPLSKSISEVQMINAGTGYTSAPLVQLDGGYIDSVATGAHASGIVGGLGGGIGSVALTSRGFGYSSPPIVNVIHPTGENAILTAIMGNSPLFGLEVVQVIVENGGQNYSPINLAKLSFTGGLGVEQKAFRQKPRIRTAVLFKLSFFVGGGFFGENSIVHYHPTLQSGRVTWNLSYVYSFS